MCRYHIFLLAGIAGHIECRYSNFITSQAFIRYSSCINPIYFETARCGFSVFNQGTIHVFYFYMNRRNSKIVVYSNGNRTAYCPTVVSHFDFLYLRSIEIIGYRHIESRTPTSGLCCIEGFCIRVSHSRFTVEYAALEFALNSFPGFTGFFFGTHGNPGYKDFVVRFAAAEHEITYFATEAFGRDVFFDCAII